MSGFEASQFLFFGDSITDEGALFTLTQALTGEGTPSLELGYNMRFSNGLVHGEYARAILDIEGESFAYGGARAIGNQFVGPQDINVGAQVDDYLANAGTVAPGTAAEILIGFNDFSDVDPTDPVAVAQTLTQIVASIDEQVTKLASAGVETIILPTLFEGTFFPFTANNPFTAAAATQAAQAVNQSITSLIAPGLEAQGLTVYTPDFAALGNEVVENPEEFGFINASSSFLIDTENARIVNPEFDNLDPDLIAFYDSVHPSDALHQIIGSFEAAALQADDAVFLDAGDNEFRSSEGRDLIFAKEGDDLVVLNADEDIVFGGQGNDLIYTRNDSDILSGGAGNDRMGGAEGDDVVAGGSGNDVLFGGRGNDLLIDGAGSDRADGSFGDDLFIYHASSQPGDSDRLRGGSGDDTLVILFEDEGEADSLRDAFEAAGGLDDEGAFNFDDLGLEATRFEEVIISTGLEEIQLSSAMAGLVQSADWWGLV